MQSTGKVVSEKTMVSKLYQLTVFMCCIICISLPLSAEEKESGVETTTLLTLPTVGSQQSDWMYNTLAVNYVALNTMDLITTYKSLEKGAVEVNPIARTFIENKPLAIAFKAGMTGGVLFALGKMKKDNRPAALITLAVLNVVYAAVITNNIGVYLELN
jgi:hypothetical protein